MNEQDEVIGIDTNGCLICHASDCGDYNCGETLEEFGVNNLTATELRRLANFIKDQINMEHCGSVNFEQLKHVYWRLKILADTLSEETRKRT